MNFQVIVIFLDTYTKSSTLNHKLVVLQKLLTRNKCSNYLKFTENNLLLCMVVTFYCVNFDVHMLQSICFIKAIDGHYIDKKCPFTGNVSIRGRILTGVVQKMKMQRTIVIRRDYLHYIRKYNRFEKRHRNMSVHLSPCFR